MLSWDVNNGVCTFYPSLKQLETSLLLSSLMIWLERRSNNDGCCLCSLILFVIRGNFIPRFSAKEFHMLKLYRCIAILG